MTEIVLPVYYTVVEKKLLEQILSELENNHCDKTLIGKLKLVIK